MSERTVRLKASIETTIEAAAVAVESTEEPQWRRVKRSRMQYGGGTDEVRPSLAPPLMLLEMVTPGGEVERRRKMDGIEKLRVHG